MVAAQPEDIIICILSQIINDFYSHTLETYFFFKSKCVRDWVFLLSAKFMYHTQETQAANIIF